MDSLLSRPRLLDLIRRSAISPITLITAPAGYGKSTLAQQWAVAAGGPVAWAPLGAASNHPDVFLTRLTEVLPGPAPDHAQVGDVIGLLADRATASQPITIVLDDLHVIENQDVLQAIDALLLARIPHVRWLILSRTKPELTLARLRLEGAVQDIGPEQLSFTTDEIREIIDRLAPGRLSGDEIETLATRTAGWIAGIRLAISAIASTPDSSRLSTIGWTTTSWLDDYFMEEALAFLPVDVREFVLRTAPLPYLDPGLCDYVLGIRTSTRLIQEVRQRLVFVRPHGADRDKMSYHALFAESVQRIAARIMPDVDVKETHLRASMWFEEAGLLEEAAEQAVLAESWDRAEEIIHAICRPLVSSTHTHSAWYWLRKLPEENLLNDPELARWYISVLQHLGHHEAAEDAYARVRPMWLASGDPAHQAYDLLSQTLSLDMGGDPGRAMQKAYEAIEIAPDELAVDLMRAWSYIYQIESFRGNDDEADHAYREAERHRAHLPADQWYWSSQTEPHRINTEAIRGRLLTAEQLYTHKLENLPQTQIHHDGKLRYCRSAIRLEWNDAEGVEAELDEIHQQVLSPPYRIWHQEALMYVGQAKGAFGDLDGMEATLREARTMFQERGGRRNLNRLEALEIELWLATERLPLAQDWARRKSQETYAPPMLFGDPDPRLARVKTWMASGEPDQALRDLAPMIEDATNRRCWAELVGLASWRMGAHVMKGDHTSALDDLRLALRHGKPGGFVRSFILPGIVINDFLNEAWPQLEPGDALYVTRLIQHGIWPTPREDDLPANRALVDPLSARELEVLQLLEPGLSNRDIGERLFISERTVKKHVGNILRKLGARNRRMAVERARLVQLIDESIA